MFRSGFVTIIGRPNTGKSTLLNRILDFELSIVSPKAQTTRDSFQGVFNSSKGQIVFLDTPGLHRAKKGGINEILVDSAIRAMRDVDVVWYMVDPDSAMKHETVILDALEKLKNKTQVIVVFNKSDVGEFREKVELLKVLEQRGVKATDCTISAKKGKGLEKLLDFTWRMLKEGPQYYPVDGALSDRSIRFFAAEKVREQLFMKTGDEIPYSCAVEIREFREPRNRKEKTFVSAIIHVERDSQKGMIIGRQGKKIKEIGAGARSSIERLVDGPVFLELNVNVLKNWSKDKRQLKELGYLRDLVS